MMTTMSYVRRNFNQRHLIFCVIILGIGGFLYRSNTFRIETVQKEFTLNFIPANYQACEDLVQNISFHGIQMSPAYEIKSREFDEAVINATAGEGVEGYSKQVIGQYLIMHYLAGQSAAKRICETGFNLGHSSFNYLTANEHAIVHSFDLGNHAYAHKMAAYLKKVFPTRFFIHFGDSTKTIPEFTRNNSAFQCDFIFVDGGHVYPVALADLKNFAKFANLEGNVIVFDDYPTDWGKHFGKAWEDVRKEELVNELMRCTFRNVDKLQRGFTIGRVMKRPMEAANTTAKP